MSKGKVHKVKNKEQIAKIYEFHHSGPGGRIQVPLIDSCSGGRRQRPSRSRQCFFLIPSVSTVHPSLVFLVWSPVCSYALCMCVCICLSVLLCFPPVANRKRHLQPIQSSSSCSIYTLTLHFALQKLMRMSLVLQTFVINSFDINCHSQISPSGDL